MLNEILQNEEMIAQIVAAIVGLVFTSVLGVIGWATIQVRDYFKLKKIETGRTILDEVIENVKATITPEMIDAGEDALAAYITKYILDTADETRRKINADEKAVHRRSRVEAQKVIKRRREQREERQRGRTVPGATPSGGVIYADAETGGA